MSSWTTSQVFPVTGRIVGITMDNSFNVYFTVRTGLWKVNLKDDSIPVCLLTISVLRNLVWTPPNTLYICNFEQDHIFQYDIDTGIVTVLSGATHGPWGLALDKDKNFLITEQHKVSRINLVNNTVEAIAGDSQSGFPVDSTQTAPEAKFHHPMGLAQSEDGTIYLCDCTNGLLRYIRNGFVSIMEIEDKKLNNPFGLAFYGKHQLLVADRNCALIGPLTEGRWNPRKIRQGITYSVAVDTEGGILLGCDNKLVRMQNRWNWERFLWIGFLKEDSSYCLVAGLPREIVKEIALHWRVK